MNKFVIKSLLNSVLANLPKTLSFFNEILKANTEKYNTDFVFLFTSVDDSIFIVPGVIDDNNNFEQKKVNINGTEHESLKLEDFVKQLIEEKLK